MRVLTFLTFVIAMAAMIGMDIFLFSEDELYGFGGIIGILSFFITDAIRGLCDYEEKGPEVSKMFDVIERIDTIGGR